MKHLPLIACSLLLFTCETTFSDTRDLPEPPMLPAVPIECPPTASIQADKMNVVYVGVDNPISIDLKNAAQTDLRVSGEGGSVSGANGKYILNPSQIGEMKLLAYLNGILIVERSFRAKQIPDPFVKLSGSTGGSMGSGQFKAQRGLYAAIENFDFEARCNVTGYTITRVLGSGMPVSNRNNGGAFAAEGLKLIQQAAPGDLYTFTDVLVRCPGDQANRRLNSLAFLIK